MDPHPANSEPTRRSVADVGGLAASAAAAAVTLLLAAYFVTHGSWALFEPEPFGSFFDAQLESLLDGRIDVDPRSIGHEAFVRDGRSYGYFGPAPALLRLPARLIGRPPDGTRSRLAMLVTCALNLLGTILAARTVQKLWPVPERRLRLARPLLLLITGAGSTNLFLMSRASTYHEAIAWAATAALFCFVAVAEYLHRPSAGKLAAVIACAALCLLARQSTGIGPLVACVGLAAGGLAHRVLGRDGGRLRAPVEWLLGPAAPSTRAALLFGAGAVLSLGLHAGQNYAKMGTPFGFPVQYNLHYSADRLARIDNKLMHASNVPLNLAHYFAPTSIRIEAGFPGVRLTRRLCDWFPRPRFDMVEPYASLSAGAPALFVLFLIGAVCVFARGELRPFRLPLAAAAACGAALLPLVAITYRYGHDWYPMLVLGAAAGMQALLFLPAGRRRLALTGVALLAAWSVYANVNFAFAQQLENAVDTDVARSFRYRQIKSRVNDLFRLEPLEPVTGPQAPADPARGQTWITEVDGKRSVYWYNGQLWVLLDGAPFSYAARLRVEFREKNDVVEPILSAGRPGSGALLYVRYMQGMRVAFGLEGDGLAPIEGPSVKVEPGETYTLDVDVDLANGQTLVKLEGRRVLRYCCGLPAARLDEIALGVNAVSDVGERRFTGRVWPQ